MTSRNDDLAAQSGAYALNALTDEERTVFERHLTESVETRTETTELSDTAVALGLAVDPVTPPSALKANLMAMIAQTPQLPREVPAVVTPSITPVVEPAAQPIAVPAAVPQAESPAQAKAQARWFTRPATALAAVAAAVALIVAGGVIGDSLGNTTPQEVVFAAQQADQLAAINAAGDSQRLVSTVTGGATATFVWSDELNSSAVIVDGLEPLLAGQVYELWYIDGSGARSAGFLNATTDGPTWRVLDGEKAVGDVVGVTIEPKGGSEEPTTDPIVVFESA